MGFFFLLRQNVRNRKIERTSEVLHTQARPMLMAMAKLPSIIVTGRSDKLSKDRRSQWSAKINHKDLTACKLSDKKSTLHVW